MQRPLLTVHGVGTLGSTGGWQEGIFKIISPHFECHDIKYPHYRWFGLLIAIIEPWALFPGLLLAGVLWFLLGSEATWRWVTTIIIVILSLVLSFIRRRLALGYFVKHFVIPTTTLRPNVIAHSMGTYLIGTALHQRRPRVSVNHMILAGCVLPAEYPWQKVYQSDGTAFQSVRNEVGRLDPIPWLAAICAKCGLLPDFGNAGLGGFRLVKDFVHTMQDANTMCQDCRKNVILARIHNVVGPFGHGGALTPENAAIYWLPWLWGIESDKYSSWIEINLTANAHCEDKNWLKLRIAEEELLEWRWKDNDPEKLRDIIAKFVRYHPRNARAHSDVATAQVLSRLYRDIATACRAHQERHTGWESTILSLNPEIAVARAVDKVLG